jgi:PAS domain-containing protein
VREGLASGRPVDRSRLPAVFEIVRRVALFLPWVLLAAAPAAADGLRVRPTWPDAWPMDPAPLTSDRWPALPPALAPRPPATPAASRIVALLSWIQAEQRDTAYQHRTVVNARHGIYRWDCSGMVSWVIRRAAPRAGRAVDARTSARGIHRLIARAPTDRSRRGWQRVTHIADARAGDVFAWRTPPGSPSRHTGHTGFVLERPRPVEGLRDAYAVRVADSVVGPHQDDRRPADGGLGHELGLREAPSSGPRIAGVFVFLTDGEGRATHYGWHGTRTRGYMRTRVLFGRLWR